MRITRFATTALVAMGIAIGICVSIARPMLAAGHPMAVAGQTDIRTGFSPNGSAERIVLQAINGAQHSIRMTAYTLSAQTVARALIEARSRGVDVAVVADYKANYQEDRARGSAILAELAQAGIPVRVVSLYDALHSKYMVLDGLNLQTGSYNYSNAAAHYNAENVVLIAQRPDIAAIYISDWQTLYAQGRQVPATP
jgi:phosphatidylserine/phosphatidylglycerophosphate/cardiolipin synthase-like enzyme